MISPCKVCKEFKSNCADMKKCEDVRKDIKLRSFPGVRCTSDGFDCALPVTFDSHSACSYDCLYCFSDNIQGHDSEGQKKIGQASLTAIENIFSGREGKSANLYRKALKYDNRNKNGFPCPVQVGGLCDPGDSIELNQGWLKGLLELAVKYDQPLRLSTKGGIFLLDDYLDIIKKAPHLFWIAFSTISNDDDLIMKVDKHAPPTSVRIASMQKLTEIGASVSLRLRPIVYGVTDRNKGHLELIKRAAGAGAKAISYETMFYPTRVPASRKHKMIMLNKISKEPLEKIYRSFGKVQTCNRPSYVWTEEIMHSVYDQAKSEGMTVGVSDPTWKQLSDAGCCCGILPDDPVFGNWERENATNAMIKAKKSKNKLIYFEDINPPWASEKPLEDMVNLGAGPFAAYKRRHISWEDSLRSTWNNVGGERSPANYFQGALVPIKKRDSKGNVIYKYVGLKRTHKKFGWNT